jgi:hypothetical protein
MYESDSSQKGTPSTTFLTAGAQVLMDVSIAGATTRIKTVIVSRRLKISSWSLSIAFSCLGLAVFCLNLLAPYWFRLNQSGIGPYASDQDITRYVQFGVEAGERERERERDWRATDVIRCYLSYSNLSLLSILLQSLSLSPSTARLGSGGPMLSILLQRITNSHGDISTPILLHS